MTTATTSLVGADALRKLQPAYSDLLNEQGPRLLTEFLKIYGTKETPGPGDNPAILAWAARTGMSRTYTDDSTPWCGLGMAWVVLQAGHGPLPVNPLGARNWLTWGTDVRKATDAPAAPALADVLVFWRDKSTGWAGHVGIYVGEDVEAFHVLGANQSDAVNIKRIEKRRLLGARRCRWKIDQPQNVRQIHRRAVGGLSVNEA